MKKIIPLFAFALMLFGAVASVQKAEARGTARAVGRVGGVGRGVGGFHGVRNVFRNNIGFNRRNIGFFGGFGFRNHSSLFNNYLSVHSAYCASSAYVTPSYAYAQQSVVAPAFAPADVAPCPQVAAVAAVQTYAVAPVYAVQYAAVVPVYASYGVGYATPFFNAYGSFHNAFGFNRFGFRGFGFNGIGHHGFGGVRGVGRRF